MTPATTAPRMWDALVEVVRHALSTDLPPESHGARPRLTVTTDFHSLRAGVGKPGTTDDALELDLSAIRRLACDADVIPAVLGSRGEVLDVGRLQRLVTAAIWRTLVLRDRHCAFPGAALRVPRCTRPPVMCHAHHIEHWTDGGETSLANLVLLCGHHHWLIHDSPWEVRLSRADQRPEFRPAPKDGRVPGWLRHRPRRE